MSACPSSPITLLAACGDTAPDLADAAVESAAGHVGEDLLVVLAAVSDPRKSRGVRHRLLTVLAAAVCAVLAGARSYVAITEWAADLPISVRLRLGMGHRAPSESTLPRVLQRVDADELDTAVSAWPARRVADPSPADAAAETGPVRAIALDGKTTRGARVRNGRAVHLLGVLDHTTGVVPGQTEVDATTNEITAFTPLLQRIDTACPLHGAVITADALHTQDRHARWLHDHGAHYVFIIKANRATLPAQLAELPCAAMSRVRGSTRPVDVGMAGSRPAPCNSPRSRPGSSSHTPAWPPGPCAVGARSAAPRSGRPRPSTRSPASASPTPRAGRLAEIIRGHWHGENRLHWVRDVTFAEDLSQIRTGTGPAVMAEPRDLAISIHRLAGATNIATACRDTGRHPTRAADLLT